MRSRSARWDAAIVQSHRLAIKVDVWRNGVAVVEGLSVIDGSITWDRTAKTLARLQITLAEPTRLPTPTGGVLSPYGYELAVSRGIIYGDGVTERLPLGVFPIQSADVSGQFLSTSITAMDRSQTIADARFEDDYQVAAGTNLVTAITTLLTAAMPALTVFATPTAYTTSLVTFTAQSDRWEACQQMARSAGYELFFDGLGRAVLRPEAAGSVVWSLSDGAGGGLVDVGFALDRAPTYNRVIVTSANAADGAIYRAVATDNNPASATYYFGPFGKKPKFYASPFISSTAQAQASADAILSAALGIGRTLRFACVPNPALEAGDVVQINRSSAGINQETHVVDTLTLGLSAVGGMTGTTRAKQAAA